MNLRAESLQETAITNSCFLLKSLKLLKDKLRALLRSESVIIFSNSWRHVLICWFNSPVVVLEHPQ